MLPRGAASTTESLHQTLPWAPNPDGPRSIEDAVGWAKTQGIHIPDEVRLIGVPDAMIRGAFAEFALLGNLPGTDTITLDMLIHELTGWIPVRVQQSVLASDEAILAVFGHEMHEINAILAELKQVGRITAGRLHNLINPQTGTLHLEAVKAGDRLVLKLRGGGP